MIGSLTLDLRPNWHLRHYWGMQNPTCHLVTPAPGPIPSWLTASDISVQRLPKIPLYLDCSSLVLTLFWLPAFLIWGKCFGSLSWLDSALAGPPGLTSRKSSQVPTKTGSQVVHANLRSSHSLDPNMEGMVERKEPWIEVGEMQIQAATWPFTSCVIWSRFFNLTEFQFPYLQNGENNSYS